MFAAEGTGVPTDESRGGRGVGPGTLYRHYPTKEALFVAVAVRRVNESIEEAPRLAGMDDPAGAVFDYLRSLGAQFQARKNLIEVIAAADRACTTPIPELARDLDNAIGALLTRAQAAGEVRKDVTVRDVTNLVVGVFSATTHVVEVIRIMRICAEGMNLRPVEVISTDTSGLVLTEESARSRACRGHGVASIGGASSLDAAPHSRFTGRPWSLVVVPPMAASSGGHN